VTPDASLGGYFEKHSRPPAFQGSDGASYSVDVYIEEDQRAEAKYSAALIFVRWSADGAQPVGHLETEYLVRSDRRADAKAALYALSLHDVKEHLERLIERKQEIPDW
jgi:hypothetical protein